MGLHFPFFVLVYYCYFLTETRIDPMNKNTPSPEERNTFIRGTAMAVALLVLILGTVAGIWWFLAYTEDDGLIYPNVYALGLNLGGMTPEDAAAALHEQTDGTYTVQPMTVVLPDTTLTLSPADTGAKVDVELIVQQAFAYGRSGNRWENTQFRAQAALISYEMDVSGCVTLDQEYIRQVVDQAAANAASTLTQATVTVTGETPNLNLTYEKAMEQTDVLHKELVLTMGTPDRSLDTAALTAAIVDAYYQNRFEPITMDYQVKAPEAVDVQAIYQQHCIAPVDAVLNETDYSISHEVLGYGFDAAALQTLIDGAGEGEVLTVPFTYIPANLTWAAIDATLFQDVLGSVSTNHTNDSNRNTNLKLACQSLNGKIIRPGETFSYNEALGERTKDKGYKPAGAYMAGKTVETVGGGICQVSSTLYYACLKADLEIVERTAHGYTVSYLPYGMDATVSWGSLDYKFKNNTAYPIRIEAGVSGGQVHVKLMGTDDKDYYVKMVYETVEGPVEGKVVYEEYKPGNKEGYKDGDVIQTAYTGRTVKTYRVKYDKTTDEKLSSAYEATSRYKSRDKIIAKVVTPPPPEPAAPADSNS